MPEIERSRFSRFIVLDVSLAAGIFYFVIRVAWLPAIVYRYALKATFWFYWPLIFVSSQGKFRDYSWRKDWCKKGASAKDKFALISAVFVLLASAFFLLTPGSSEYVGHAIGSNVPLTAMTWLVLMDWAQLLDQPWRWFSLSNAVLTIILYFWLSEVRSYQKINPDRYAMTGWPVGFLVFLARLSLVLFILYWATALWYIMDDRVTQNALGPTTPYIRATMNFIRQITPL